MHRLLILLFLTFTHLHAYRVDVISFFPITDLGDLPQGIDFHHLTSKEINENYLDEANSIDKCVIVNYKMNENSPVFQLPKEKLIFFQWEPDFIENSYFEHFSKVYTWNDSLVDNLKFFKIFYPFIVPMTKEAPSFNEKKFSVMITSRWTPERLQMIRFFEEMPRGDFDCFGYFPPPISTPLYLGRIHGYHSGSEKFDVLKNYRFNICFENSSQPGYITEKIFSCFASGCIPVYWGAPNVTDYIPKECFIDYRDFGSDQELYQHLKSITEEEYNEYLENIRHFLESKQGLLFTRAHYEATFFDAIAS